MGQVRTQVQPRPVGPAQARQFAFNSLAQAEQFARTGLLPPASFHLVVQNLKARGLA